MTENLTTNRTYTTGELAEACGVTVRSVQYYDEKGLLVPTDYSDGGRRLYSEEDATRLRYILLLKALGLKLSQIDGILKSPNHDAILDTLLEEQVARIAEEVARQEEALSMIQCAQSDLKLYGKLMAKSQAAMDVRMNDRKALLRWHAVMLVGGLCMDVAWIGTLIYGILTGVWWPFPLGLVFAVLVGTWLVVHTDAHSTYLCPVCHAEFRPKLWDFFFAGHSATTRKLTCPCCDEKDWCIEHYHEARVTLAPGECVPGTCTKGTCEKGGEAQ